ncbi:MAG: chromosome segregation protein SMC [Bacilli bacterium]
MFLKRLDLLGFKSFADRIELEMAPGVTAVVGPNGSGKSNIADAIRWVLGEQSARTLRGAKMEDVIFAGSQARKSVNFCEVSLTLDNSDAVLPLDYNEVTVTRRVYRSGDSEYLINRSACRLRDIAELFMDTGVGREAYSIIGQGRIEEILSTKSEERRGVFEEAAGIVKFKLRRKEAERKLGDAEQNLLRIRDIVAALADQVAPLADQALIAREYKAVQMQQRTLQIAVLAVEIAGLSENRSESLRQLEESRAELLAAQGQEVAAQQQFAVLRAAAEGLDQELFHLQESLVEVTGQVEQCVADRRVAFERQEHAITLLEELRLQRERLLGEADSCDRTAAAADVQVAELQGRSVAMRAELQRRIADQDGQGLLAALRERLVDARAALIELMREQAGLRNELKNLESAAAQTQRRKERMAEERAAVLGEGERLRAEYVLLEERSSLLQNSVLAMRETAARTEQEYSRAQDELGVTRTDWEQRDRKRLEVVSRLRTLQDMQLELDGYAGGPKAVIQAQRRGVLKGVHGAVADLLTVPAEYELAIETALGGSVQHIVVERDSDARQAIDMLKKRQLGRATFLPVETIKGRRLAPHELQMVKSAHGFVGAAAGLVQCDGRFRAIVDSLLGNVLIVQTLAEANVIARVLQHRVRIVTIGGDVVNAGGSMTGGSAAKRGVGILFRTREIGVLSGEAATLAEQVTALEKKRAAQETVAEDLRLRLSAEQARIGEQEDKRRDVGAGLQVAAAALAAATERAAVFDQEYALLCTESESVGFRFEEVQNSLLRVESEVDSAEGAVAQSEHEIAEHETMIAGHNDALTHLRVSLAEQEEALRGADQARASLASRRKAIADELRIVNDQQQAAILRIDQLRAHLQDCERAVDTVAGARAECQAEILRSREAQSGCQRELEEAERARDNLRTRTRQWEGRINACDSALAKIDMELDAKLTTLREDFGLGVDLATERHRLDEPLAEARQRLQELKRRSEAFGDVNIGAIEEYERVSERHAFLQSQEQDLLSAKEQLHALIAEIDAEMSKRFRETFDSVRQHFGEVFRALFEGGRADVFLVDDTQPLLSGIEIVAEPPGKKMQSLSLLSGGERALTALALLFAILRVKPVPFCVLDEVEAALDEANVTRFSDYLRGFAERTQFVVITHRRGTMEAADMLYGVTMQDSGVSKLVSVRVLDDEPATA